jgi:hypothetical protein
VVLMIYSSAQIVAASRCSRTKPVPTSGNCSSADHGEHSPNQVDAICTMSASTRHLRVEDWACGFDRHLAVGAPWNLRLTDAE